MELRQVDPEQRSDWWRWIRKHCLEDDTFWHIRNRYYSEAAYAAVFYNQDVGAWFLRTLQTRLKRGAVNVLTYGQQRGSKTYSTLFLAERLDPTFTVATLEQRVFFRLTQLQRALDKVPVGSVVVCDEVRQRFGQGSRSEVVQIANFLETKAKKGVSIFFCTPTLKLEGLFYGINFSIEIYGYSKETGLGMGMLYNWLKEPIGFIWPGCPSKPLITVYEAHKDQFLAQHQAPASEFDDEIQLLQANPLWDSTAPKAEAELVARVLLPEYPLEVAKTIAFLALKAGKHKAAVIDVQAALASVPNPSDEEQILLEMFRHVFITRVSAHRRQDHATWWCYRCIDGKTYPEIAKLVHDAATAENIGKEVREMTKWLNRRDQNTFKGKIWEEAIALALAQLLKPTNELATQTARSFVTKTPPASSCTDFTVALVGGPGHPDVQVTRGEQVVALVNGKFYVSTKGGYQEACDPEWSLAPDRAWMLLLELHHAAPGIQRPHPRLWLLRPNPTGACNTGSVQDRVKLRTWLAELRGLRDALPAASPSAS